MSKLLDGLKDYFENTPADILAMDWEELKHLNEFGSDVLSYAEVFDRAAYSCAFDFENVSNADKEYSGDTKYYLAA